MKVVIIHGVYNNPSGNWFAWLKDELEKEGHSVLVPRFPTPVNQSLENWMKAMERYKKEIGEECVLVGHSLGATFILSWLEQNKAKAAFLVGGFHKKLGIPLDKINSTFIEKVFDWKMIKANCPKRILISSDNDPYIPMEVTKELQKKLRAELSIVKGGQHLNAEVGYMKFTLLKEMVLRELK